MIRDSNPAVLAATAIVSLAIGFGVATLLPLGSGPTRPIINSDAWAEQSPAAILASQPVRVVEKAGPQKCSPWEISDVAMEEVLDEMLRRGWRAPTQGAAVASFDTVDFQAIDPNAPMPPRGGWWTASATEEAVVEAVPAAELPVEAAPEQPEAIPAAVQAPPPPPA